MATYNIGYNAGGTALDYTTIALWEDATDTSLSAIETGVLNYSNNAASLVWTESVSIIGATTTSSFYRVLKVASGLKHTGQEATGVRWKATSTSADALYVQENYFRVQDIEFFDSRQGITIDYWSNILGLLVERCILRDMSPPDGGAFINLYQDSGQYATVIVRNCLLYDNNAASGDSHGIRSRGSSSGTLEVYNCIFDQVYHGTYGCGITTAGAGTNTITNVISTRSHGASGKDFDCATSGTKTVTYCASEDATADDRGGSGNDISITVADWFTDPDGATPDYTHKTGSPGIDGGTSVSGFSDDLIDVTRSGTWDQGCFEESGGGNVTVTNPIASASGSAPGGFTLGLSPRASVSAAAQSLFSLGLSSVASGGGVTSGGFGLSLTLVASAGGSALAGSVSIGTIISDVIAQAAASAITGQVNLSITVIAAGAGGATQTFTLSLTPSAAIGVISALVGGVSTGILAAFVVVLDQTAYIISPNRVKIRHMAIEDTNLDEFAITPEVVAWLSNKPRFRHQKVQN